MTFWEAIIDIILVWLAVALIVVNVRINQLMRDLRDVQSDQYDHEGRQNQAMKELLAFRTRVMELIPELDLEARVESTERAQVIDLVTEGDK